jgi:four helix bundle protein
MYGEAQAAESRADFIHKMKILLKELRETMISLRIINEKPLVKDEKIAITLQECNELIGIFTKSIETAKKNRV